MKIKMHVKIDEYAGIIYERPILEANGMFDGETELEQTIEELSTEIRKTVTEYMKKRDEK